MLVEYSNMFAQGYQNLDALQAQYQAAFGSSYDMFDPELLDLMEETQRSSLESGPDLSDRRELCSSDAFYSAMRMDQVPRRPNTASSFYGTNPLTCLLTPPCRSSFLASSPWRRAFARRTTRRTRPSPSRCRRRRSSCLLSGGRTVISAGVLNALHTPLLCCLPAPFAHRCTSSAAAAGHQQRVREARG